MVWSGNNGPDRHERSAALALLRATAVLRQHPHAAALHHTAIRQCLDSVRAGTRTKPLRLAVRASGLVVPGEEGCGDARLQAPFVALHRAGVGAIELAAGISAVAIAVLVQRLADLHAEADPEACYRRIAAPGLAQVRLCAGTIGDGPALAGLEAWFLPAPAPIAVTLRPLVARELGCNLAALALRQLLDDLEDRPLANAEMLTALFARTLGDGDLATASWLLAETAHHPRIPDGAHQRLCNAASARLDEAWLQQRLEQGTREELTQLASFVMELGDDAAERFARLAQASAQPWSQWLCELLGRPA